MIIVGIIGLTCEYDFIYFLSLFNDNTVTVGKKLLHHSFSSSPYPPSFSSSSSSSSLSLGVGANSPKYKAYTNLLPPLLFLLPYCAKIWVTLIYESSPTFLLSFFFRSSSFSSPFPVYRRGRRFSSASQSALTSLDVFFFFFRCRDKRP
jgi:hypothetical protein